MRNEEKCGGFLLSSPEPPKEVSYSITQRSDGLATNAGMKLIVNSHGGMAGEVLLKHLDGDETEKRDAKINRGGGSGDDSFDPQ